MTMAITRYRTKKAKKITGIVQTKIVRVDERTQIEVPVHIADEVAIERFLQRRKVGPRPVIIKTTPDEELLPPEELNELLEEDAEQDEDEKGDE